MASSSLSSGARSSSNAGDVGYYPNPSPIPYREHALAYEPASNCWCEEKGARRISWTNANPGRRFLNCQKSRDGGCKWFEWFDDPTTPFLRQLLVDLRDTVHNLRRENARLN
ncbi:uncharacterized protein LOC119329378 [Triticum dicoccoides]|uniref:GRF-type domain-containing protein n=1 Tax=Triticum turgidum subsp. durum TaxID=4567 RepID=A0A9R1BL45_TRITD|nr:uncharacterized protein LOC119329378 [Triticum dicoccoides]VAI72627.1 unnamed protein product [Triticum turgidum subsp. durum]